MEAGSTMPANRLTRSSAKPTASRPRRAQSKSLDSAQTTDRLRRFFFSSDGSVMGAYCTGRGDAPIPPQIRPLEWLECVSWRRESWATKQSSRHPSRAATAISVIRGSGICRSWNNIRYKTGMSAKNVGSKKLSMNVATIPPGGVAFAHIHVDFEVMLYILEGRVRHEYGDGLRAVDRQRGG